MEFLQFLGVMFIVMFITIASIIFLANWSMQYQCSNYAIENPQKTVKFKMFDSCYVDGRRWDEHLAYTTASALKN